ncbi:hypothetical protein [Methylobacterium sp. UNC378MF]|uniref:hypothetical protein n=1 Tax=Methylobacterium sp. UNC378MF TaxID=1502748 RepID=UPI001FCD4276|nr:hypothetical protein [Methylobacterium sp. UNC378MF]
MTYIDRRYYRQEKHKTNQNLELEMSHRSISWNALSRSLYNSRPVIAAGTLSAKARIAGFVRINRRHLVVADQYDRSAIMAAAAFAARGHRERFGCSWAEALSLCLRAAWNAAKVTRALSAQ